MLSKKMTIKKERDFEVRRILDTDCSFTLGKVCS